ncbi:hypothetical protein, partial [Mesorhizobium sp. M7A.F.Ca.CA.004.11.1.1]|uniref:hypothetical protein n=1 Tax=Mesorhizobium sp. M7A.F.Ca.CA.004.11.1.1 TaxID=2496698 RepID=UPI0019CFDB07
EELSVRQRNIDIAGVMAATRHPAVLRLAEPPYDARITRLGSYPNFAPPNVSSVWLPSGSRTHLTKVRNEVEPGHSE